MFSSDFRETTENASRKMSALAKEVEVVYQGLFDQLVKNKF